MMPIGVPRVPYRAPQAGGWQWVDIWNCLVRKRILQWNAECERTVSLPSHISLFTCEINSVSTNARTEYRLCVQYRERIIFLSKAVDEELGNQLVATMLYLDSENKKDITLYINCSGGDVRSLSNPSC